MNFTEEEKALLGQEVLDTISTPLTIIDQDYIKLDLPFKVEDILKFKDIDELQKLKLRIAEDVISIFLKYPTLYSLGFMYMDNKYTVSLSTIGWDYSEVLMKTDGYKKCGLIVHAFTGNFLNGKRDIKFIRNINNEFSSYNEIKKEVNEIFSYLNEGNNSQLLINYSRKEKNSWYFDFSTIKWSGDKNKKLSSELHDFLGNEFVKSLAYTDMNNFLPTNNNIVSKPNKI